MLLERRPNLAFSLPWPAGPWQPTELAISLEHEDLARHSSQLVSRNGTRICGQPLPHQQVAATCLPSRGAQLPGRTSAPKWLLQRVAATCWLWHGVRLERRRNLAFNRPWPAGPWQPAELAICLSLEREALALHTKPHQHLTTKNLLATG